MCIMPLKDATGATDSTSCEDMTTNMMCLDDVRVPRVDLHSYLIISSSRSLPSTPIMIIMRLGRRNSYRQQNMMTMI